MTADRIAPLAGHELRYRRLGGGYRREDVEQVLAELQWAMRVLEEDLEALRSSSAGLESEAHDARAELESYRARERELEQTVEAAGEVLERASKLDAAAFERSQGVVVAMSSLREDVERLEQAVSELGVLAVETEPADRAEPVAP